MITTSRKIISLDYAKELEMLSTGDDLPAGLQINGHPIVFNRPPYMPFDDQDNALQRIQNAASQRTFLLLFGYAGCGKTTVLRNFSEQYPAAKYIGDFSSLSSAMLLQSMGESIGVTIRQHPSSAKNILVRELLGRSKVMFLFDEADAYDVHNLQKLTFLRQIYDNTHVPIVISGVSYFREMLHLSRNCHKYCQLLTRWDECQMRGMTKHDAKKYLTMLSERESLFFPEVACNALLPIALNEALGGIRAFTMLLSRIMTYARIIYYNIDNHVVPDHWLTEDDPKNIVTIFGKPSFMLPSTAPDVLKIDLALVHYCAQQHIPGWKP